MLTVLQAKYVCQCVKINVLLLVDAKSLPPPWYGCHLMVTIFSDRISEMRIQEDVRKVPKGKIRVGNQLGLFFASRVRAMLESCLQLDVNM